MANATTSQGIDADRALAQNLAASIREKSQPSKSTLTTALAAVIVRLGPEEVGWCAWDMRRRMKPATEGLYYGFMRKSLTACGF